jgi:hypothetical protein
MHANQEELKRDFDSEVKNLCDILGVEGTPKYAFRVYDAPHSQVRPRLFRKPIVEIGLDYHTESHALAGEAGHLDFSFARKQLGLRDHEGYGEVADYMNRVRRMTEDGEEEEAAKHRSAFASMDPFIEEYERLAAQPRSMSQLADLFEQQSRRYGGESTNHLFGMAFIRLAFGSGMEEPEHIAGFLNSLVRRDYDIIAAIVRGNFREEFRYFREEPVRIMGKLKD